MRRWVLLLAAVLSVVATACPPLPLGTPTVTAVSASGTVSCALTSTGAVKCWGENSFGQLGDGTSAYSRNTPVDVVGLGSGVTAIATGTYHSCALTSAGGVKCWGRNDLGQLGDGTTTERNTPVDVVGLGSGVTAIATGTFTTCAVTSSGGVKCWGWNSNGQYGDGTTTDSLTPVDVPSLSSGMAAAAPGDRHSCALTSAGEVKCSGWNAYGKLGDGTLTDSLTPVNVVGLTSGVTAIAVSSTHTCAVTSAGGVKCWGFGGDGQLGDGTTEPRLTPVDVVGLSSGVTAIANDDVDSCAVTSAGGVKCWGRNAHGQLGDGTTTNRWTPVDVVGLTSGATAIANGHSHTCAVTSAGGVKCWGRNVFGQLGDGTNDNRLTAVNVVGLS